MRPFSWLVVCLALLNATFLASLPLLAENAADRLTFSRPEALPPKPKMPEKREEPVIPVKDLHEALRLPRVDESPDDEHSRASLAAYEAENYEKAFEEAVLALDPTPLGENELYRTLTDPDTGASERTQDSNAIEVVDEALQPILEAQDSQTAARLNNAAAMMILQEYSASEAAVPNGIQVAEELAYEAADLQPSCPSLLNLTLFNGASTYLGEHMVDPPADLKPAEPATWTDYYPLRECADPALYYHLAHSEYAENPRGAVKVADLLQTDPRWAGIAHSLRGDVYYWNGISSGGTGSPFTARHYFELAVEEYTAAFALQPDDATLRHGRALAYLELGRAGRNRADEGALDKAISDAKAALEAEPDSLRFRQTLADAHEAKGEHAAAARLHRELVDLQQSPAKPLALVPYSPLSHGADRYSELRVMTGSSASAVTALFDDEVIEPFMPRTYAPNVNTEQWSVPNGLNLYRSELRYYGLLRNDLLSGDLAAFGDDLLRAPEPVRRNDDTLLLIGIAKLLHQPGDSPTLETQAAIDDFSKERSRFVEEHWYADQEHSYLYEPSSGGPEFGGTDLFYLEAGNFFRQHEQYEKSLHIYGVWRSALDRARADGKRRAEVAKLMGEAHFLNGDHDEASAAFDRATDMRPDWPPYVVRKALMQEKSEEYEAAANSYDRALKLMQTKAGWMDPRSLESTSPIVIYSEYYPDPYQAAKHLGDVLLRQAQDYEAAREGNGNSETVGARFSEAAQEYRRALELSFSTADTVAKPTAAVNNLGIALLMAEREKQDYKEDFSSVIDILKIPVRGADESTDEYWQYNVEFDEHNPIFRLNLGWAHELNGEPREAKKQYLSAVKSDPSFYPALNDLGVLAARENDTDAAKGYFDAALEANSGYDHAAFNMGVALLHSGPDNFLAAQHYSGRAVAENPALSETSYDYISDNELYFLNLSLLDSVPADWRFSTHAQKSTGGLSLLVLALLLGRIAIGYARMQLQNTILGQAFFYLRRKLAPYLERYRPAAQLRDGLVRFMHFGVVSSSGWWTTPVALLVSGPAIVVVMGWGLITGDSEVKTVMLGVLLYLAVVSLLVHHAGHALAGWWFGMRVQEAPWPAGIIPSLALAAVGGPAVAPVPANIIQGEREERERERGLVYLAGPIASILFAALLFVLFLFSHIPLLRLGAILSLAVAVVSLLLLPPLDGAMVGRGRYTRLLFWAGIAMTVLWAVVYFSNQLYCAGSPGDYCWGVWF